MLDAREFWQKTDAKPCRDKPRDRRHIVSLERDFGMNAREIEELIDENAQTVTALHRDQRFILKLVQIDILPLRKPMSERYGDEELFRPEIDPCAVLCRRNRGAEAEICFACGDLQSPAD